MASVQTESHPPLASASHLQSLLHWNGRIQRFHAKGDQPGIFAQPHPLEHLLQFKRLFHKGTPTLAQQVQYVRQNLTYVVRRVTNLSAP